MEGERVEFVKLEGSFVKEEGYRKFKFYLDGWQNVENHFVELGFVDVKQVDDLMNKLLEVRKELDQ